MNMVSKEDGWEGRCGGSSCGLGTACWVEYADRMTVPPFSRS